MDLLEREAESERIQGALDRARHGSGMTVLVSGEAGIGKTALVASFVTPYRSAGQVYWGTCDPLFTPRPLGPLYDISLQRIPGLQSLLSAGTNWLDVALVLLKTLLENPAATILVFDDIHWADEATLDLLQYLARRMDQAHSLLVLTYREEEMGQRRPLRETLGNFPAEHTLRIPLQPLSEKAVGVLAQQAHRPAGAIYRATRGNPFFVTEVLRSSSEQVPRTVRDAVLTRAAHLPAPARAVLELAALNPAPVQSRLIEQVLHPEASAVDACVEGGFLMPAGNTLSFRHELARLAVADSIPFGRAKALHNKILGALQTLKSPIPLALLAHHALKAEDEQKILEYAPLAALEASAHGAHRESARHFQSALTYSHLLSAEEHARLLDGLAFEEYLTGEMEAAIQLRKEAYQFWRQAGHIERMGDDLRWLSRLYWFQGNQQEAARYAVEAIDLLEQSPPGQELAMAYSNRSQLFMLAEEFEPAIAWGRRALELANRLQNDEIVIHALTNIGSAELLSGQESGLEKLEKALTMARERNFHDHAARCYANISSSTIMHRDYPTADKYLSAGITYTADRDMGSYNVYLRGWLARMRFEQGAWDEALQVAEELLRISPGSNVMLLPAVTTIGAMKMRQGEPDASRWLDQAREMALPTAELQRIGPVAAARAEAAWWEGDRERVMAETSLGLDLAVRAGDGWQLGQLVYWAWRSNRGLPAGIQAIDLQRIPLCYRASMEGDWQTAAAEWTRLGCPYEQALALSAGSPEAQVQALSIFEQLGARTAARALREQMSLEGMKSLPRGPRSTTRANPEGLTAREMEILALLVDGASNAEIAQRMSISMKTVDHHVSTILAKLNVHSRLEAAAVARKKQILPAEK